MEWFKLDRRMKSEVTVSVGWVRRNLSPNSPWLKCISVVQGGQSVALSNTPVLAAD